SRWVSRKKYASSTAQSSRTRGNFERVFIHPKPSKSWGWQLNYVEVLKSNLSNNLPPYQNKRIPIYDLAVWLYRERTWPTETTAQHIIKTFVNDFFITDTEQQELFDVSVPDYANVELFQDDPVTWKELRSIITTLPEDVAEEGGTLAYLELQGVGPATQLKFEPAERLNILTGDNGFGKTFLLECAWWALTGQWAGLPAYPRDDAQSTDPKIIFQIASASGPAPTVTASYNWTTWEDDKKWLVPNERPTIPGLVIYARVDGSFAICDPIIRIQAPEGNSTLPRPFVFTRDQVWDGFEETVGGQKRVRINGLLRDWVGWQNNPKKHPFETFTKVLRTLSPPQGSDLGILRPGTPKRLLIDDTREFPTLEHPYGTVPVIHAAAGVRRIITLAYLLVWAWNEHRINSEEARKQPEKNIVLMIDEIEAHLHPQWQRRILPALLAVKNDLTSEYDLEVQSIIATHSPLVMASAEPEFVPERDKLFHLDFANDNLIANQVVLKELPFIHRGRVDFWLESDVFELAQARSLEAEKAIQSAKALQQQDNPAREDIARVSEELQKYLSDIDVFWPRWTFFAEKHGVEL
ncbi:MAG: ATP-binding protein, partial [Abitibacteriaceae bacterium]|nr:ATP-binding protein [Abditibacteriaceae bacterium]